MVSHKDRNTEPPFFLQFLPYFFHMLSAAIRESRAGKRASRRQLTFDNPSQFYIGGLSRPKAFPKPFLVVLKTVFPTLCTVCFLLARCCGVYSWFEKATSASFPSKVRPSLPRLLPGVKASLASSLWGVGVCLVSRKFRFGVFFPLEYVLLEETHNLIQLLDCFSHFQLELLSPELVQYSFFLRTFPQHVFIF